MIEIQKKIPTWLAAFQVNLIVALAAIAPLIIRDGGYFAMNYDFAAQEIPFQMLMNDTVKSGNLLWNWAIDLGGNFLESFSFYNLGSVFVWLSFLFPASAVPKVIGWMIIFKFAVAGATSAVYLDRHLSKKIVIILASMLYSFSGFQCTSIVFYHFLDVVALFPLMLVEMERLVEEGRRGRFALACLLNVLCNYVFFVGEAIFLVIFYIVKYLLPQIKALRNPKQIWSPVWNCAMEGIMGMMMAGILLIPAINGTLANSRVSNHILGESWFSMSTAEWLMLLKALLMPGETMHSMSSVARANWMSNAVYLPLFGIMFVIAYVISQRDYLSTMLKVGFIIAAVPLLNSVFMFFSQEGYRRWYFMFILLMALVTGKVLENQGEYKLKRAAVITVGLYVFLIVMTAIVNWNSSGDGILYHRKQYLIGMAVGIGGNCMILLTMRFFNRKRELIFCAATAVCSCFVLSVVVSGYQESADNTNVDFTVMANSYGKSVAVYLTEIAGGADRDILPYRYYFDEWIAHSYYNFAMTNSLPSVNSFISTVHSSVTEFYETHGTGRGMPWTNAVNEGARELLSVKYIVSLLEEPEYTFLEMLSNSNGQQMYLYENENVLPIGFTYDAYMTEAEYHDILNMYRRPMGMLTSLVVKNEDVDKVSDCLEHLSFDIYDKIYPEYLEEVVAQRRKECSTEFTYGDNYFTSQITADSEKYAFFSVPYDKYWKAAVNGQQVEILDINGMMAVRVEEGMNDIRFVYEYTPLKAGIACSIIGIIGCLAYWGCGQKRKAIV